jgi:hypothetical protein
MKKKSSVDKKRVSKKATTLHASTHLDLASAALIISLVINLFFVCLWVTLQITDKYDAALIDFFTNR